MQITITKSNVRKQSGSGIFSAVLPALRAVAPSIGKTLGLSALAGAASEGESQIIKKITGGQLFQIPHKNLGALALAAHLLTGKQRRDLVNADKSKKDMLFRVTPKQVGNGIGSILASIGIPLALDVIKGITDRGAPRMGNRGGGSPRIGAPPPFIGTWGRVKKKKDSRERSTTRKKQPIQKYSIGGGHSIREGDFAGGTRSGSSSKSPAIRETTMGFAPKFHDNIPLSNFDLLTWCKYLGIPISNVLSRDMKVPHNHKLALFIYNLEPSYMSGSHWVSTYVKDGVINYFDSFGMPPFQEIVDHAERKNLTLLHQNRQIQNLYTTTCGYFCLYFLNEMHKRGRRKRGTTPGSAIEVSRQDKGRDYFDLLQVFDFDTDKNEAFIAKYFKEGD